MHQSIVVYWLYIREVKEEYHLSVSVYVACLETDDRKLQA